MSYGMYLAAEGAKAQSRRLDVVANNMANVDTVGFKPDYTAFQARFAESVQLGMTPAGSQGLPDIGGGVKTIETITSFAPGKLAETGNGTDVAILGEGFFQVDSGDGPPLLTRAGDLAVDSNGTLIQANSGRAVLSADGSPIVVDGPWNVTADGYIEQQDGRTPLAIVLPQSLDDLTKIGGNLFRSRGEVIEVNPATREVRQGFLEMSGANSTDLMMQLIETNRAFQANTEMIRHQDQATGNLVGRVLAG